MPKRHSPNLRTTAHGHPIWYVFVDESGSLGHGNDGLFAMGAIVTRDPESVASIPLSYPTYCDESRTYFCGPGRSEVKNTRITSPVRREIMERLSNEDAWRFVVTIRTDGCIRPRVQSQYERMFRELMRFIQERGPDGLYRIRVDDSPCYDGRGFERIAREELRWPKMLDDNIGMRSVDSDLCPAMQAADVMIGSHRWDVSKGYGPWSVRHNRIGWREVPKGRSLFGRFRKRPLI